MRKNKMMRAASGLLVAVLLTTCIISGTFAKYVTKTSGADEARVAYWGFNQKADIDLDLFDGTYTNDDSKTTVSSKNNVVAPGTSKTTTFAFGYDENTKSGVKAPEVAYTLNVNADVTGDYKKLDANKNFKWTLTDAKDVTTEYQTVEELVKAIEKLSGNESGSKNYEAGELPTAFTSADETYTVGWKWAYSTDDEGDTTDTSMGNDADLDNVNITITITATQID